MVLLSCISNAILGNMTANIGRTHDQLMEIEYEEDDEEEVLDVVPAGKPVTYRGHTCDNNRQVDVRPR